MHAAPLACLRKPVPQAGDLRGADFPNTVFRGSKVTAQAGMCSPDHLSDNDRIDFRRHPRPYPTAEVETNPEPLSVHCQMAVHTGEKPITISERTDSTRQIGGKL